MPSRFDGGLGEYIILCLIGVIISSLTLGLATPWAICMLYRWRIEHTVIEGRRLQFNGTGMDLFVQWIKWWFLTFITLGIYGFWLVIKVEQWKVKHTTFMN